MRMANLMKNDMELKTNCNTLSVPKSVAEFPVTGSGLSPQFWPQRRVICRLTCALKLLWGWKRGREPPPGGLRGWSPWTKFLFGIDLLQISFARARDEFCWVLWSMWYLNLEKNRGSFNAGEWGLLLMMMLIWGLRLILTILCEDCDHGLNPNKD